MTHRLKTKRLTRHQRARQTSPQRSGYEGAAAVSEHRIRERRIGKIEIKVLRARLGAHPYGRKTGKLLAREEYEIVVKNPNMVADMVETLRPVPKNLFAPKIEKRPIFEIVFKLSIIVTGLQ